MAKSTRTGSSSELLLKLFRPKVCIGDLYAGTSTNLNKSSPLQDGARGTVEQIFESLNNPSLPVRKLNFLVAN